MNQLKPTHRLSDGAYREIEKQCKLMLVETNTTELQVAHILGQQSVLKILRDGFTIGT